VDNLWISLGISFHTSSHAPYTSSRTKQRHPVLDTGPHMSFQAPYCRGLLVLTGLRVKPAMTVKMGVGYCLRRGAYYAPVVR